MNILNHKVHLLAFLELSDISHALHQQIEFDQLRMFKFYFYVSLKVEVQRSFLAPGSVVERTTSTTRSIYET